MSAVPRSLIAGLLLVALSGCGGSAPEVNGPASAALNADVTRLQAAATAGSTADVETAATAVRDEVADQVAAGAISFDRAAAILDQLARVLADAAVRPAPRATTVPRTTPSPPPEKKKGDGKGDGQDKGD